MRTKNHACSETGFTLVEILVAVAIISLVAIAILGALETASKILMSANADETAPDLAEAQFEDLQKQPYQPFDPAANPPDYPPLPSSDEGYTPFLTASRVPQGGITAADTGVQKVIIIIRQTSDPGSKELFRLEGYKTDY